MLISPLIYDIDTHMIYQKIALFHIYLMMQCITACYKIRHRDITLKTTFQKFHIKFFNINFDLGPGYFFMSCRKFVKEFFNFFSCFMS